MMSDVSHTRLTDERYWTDSYQRAEFADLSEHAVAVFLRRYLPNVSDKTSLELGSFPGAFIPTVARQGFLVHGVDFNRKNATDLPQWLRRLHYPVGEFWVDDIFDFIKDTNRKFDLVCSFGLIEHFENYPAIIDAHIALTKPGGRIVITAPNFRGLMQYLPHRLFDKRNLKRHYLPSMNPSRWKKQLEQNGFDVSYAGYFGGYGFWVDRDEPRSTIARWSLRITERLIGQVRKLLELMKLEASTFSSFCGVVAVKR
jgi:2-polyprenyl-3-methyl-5-hydroxy-6-metoxy-1,4-benzoquinol methylase